MQYYLKIALSLSMLHLGLQLTHFKIKFNVNFLRKIETVDGYITVQIGK